MIDLIWTLCTLCVYGFEFGVMALIFIGVTTNVGRRILRRVIGL
jgi:hypothetical protein